MNPLWIRKTLIASSVALALGTPNAQAALVANVLGAYNCYTDSANFTLLAPNGGVVAVFGANDVAMNWDGNAYNAGSDYTGPGSAVNVTASSTSLSAGYRLILPAPAESPPAGQFGKSFGIRILLI